MRMRRFVRGAGIFAWCLGVMAGLVKALVYYGTGPFIVYLMIKYLT